MTLQIAFYVICIPLGNDKLAWHDDDVRQFGGIVHGPIRKPTLVTIHDT